MKTNPTISIVMPMYGVEKYIGKAIESVLSQSYQDWELIVVNDGSPDKSRDIASAYAENDGRIKILDKENGGLSDARNYGLINASGEFVHFFDSDDWIEPDFYSTLLTSIKDYDLVVSGYKVDSQISVNERCRYNGNLRDCIGNTLCDLVCKYLNFAWNKLFRKSFLLANRLNYEKGLYRIEDSEFMSRFLKYNPRVILINYSGYHYRIGNMSTLSNVTDSKVLDHALRSLDIHTEIFNTLCCDSEIVKNELGKYNFSILKTTIYKMLKGVPFYKFIKCRRILEQINQEQLTKYLVYYIPVSFYDKILYVVVKNRMWFIISFFANLKNELILR